MDALTEIDTKEKTSGLSAILSEPRFVSAGPIPFVNEEDFRSPLVKRPALRHWPIRCGVELGCNPPLFVETTARIGFLLSKILSSPALPPTNNPKILSTFTIIYSYYSMK
jgi:hypothetical protein